MYIIQHKHSFYFNSLHIDLDSPLVWFLLSLFTYTGSNLVVTLTAWSVPPYEVREIPSIVSKYRRFDVIFYTLDHHVWILDSVTTSKIPSFKITAPPLRLGIRFWMSNTWSLFSHCTISIFLTNLTNNSIHLQSTTFNSTFSSTTGVFIHAVFQIAVLDRCCDFVAGFWFTLCHGLVYFSFL